MVPALLGLIGAFIFGSADFLGGLAAKRISAMLATAVAAVSGLVLLLVVLPFLGGTWSVGAVLWGGLSGVTGAVAISLLYACLAIGPMSILSPLTAVVSAVVPMTVGLVGGDRFAPIGYWALGLALVAVVLVGFVPEKGAVRPSAKGILTALGSGAAIGSFMILIDLTPADSGLVPLVMNRAVNGGIMFALVGVLALVAGRKAARGAAGIGAAGIGAAAPGVIAGGPTSDGGAAGEAVPGAVMTDAAPTRTQAARLTVRTGVLLAVGCGAVDVVANTMLLIGIRLGDLSVMSVLTAMYPAGTILLAAVVLKERIAPVQWAGLVLAIAAAGMLAIA
ncbi:EamA family transporter [Glaciibacter sp. 2TAF33]|uniref:EamA family transporter n=1 Tax=Glaciibacter sp. 2TAF33 TaxID=3233015 RepID=UPI003F90C965